MQKATPAVSEEHGRPEARPSQRRYTPTARSKGHVSRSASKHCEALSPTGGCVETDKQNVTPTDIRCSLQFRVLRLGLLQDGDDGGGVFPEGEEILVCSVPFGFVAGHGVGTAQSQASQRTRRATPGDS